MGGGLLESSPQQRSSRSAASLDAVNAPALFARAKVGAAVRRVAGTAGCDMPRFSARKGGPSAATEAGAEEAALYLHRWHARHGPTTVNVRTQEAIKEYLVSVGYPRLFEIVPASLAWPRAGGSPIYAHS